MCLPQDSGNVPGLARPRTESLGVRVARGGRADEQRRRAGVAARRPLAEVQRWDGPTKTAAGGGWRPAALGGGCGGGRERKGGSRFVEGMLSTEATGRQRGGRVLASLGKCSQPRLVGVPAPSLLPNEEPAMSRA